jgi:hypothetical protein
MSNPGLEIPLRFNVGKVPADLARVGAAGKKAGDEVDQGMKKAKGGTESFGGSVAGLMRAQMTLGAVKAVGHAIGDEMRRSSDYVKNLADQFARTRTTMQEIATLSGQANTNEFVVKQAQQGNKFGLTPQEQQQAQSTFLNMVGAQVGDEEGKKLSNKQAAEYSSRIGRLMKAAGYAPEQGMELGGTILQQRTGKQDVDSLMQEFSKTFNIAEKGQVAFGRAAPEIAELMSMGISSADAAKLFSVASPASKGSEGVITQAALRAIEDMKIEGKEKGFGVTTKMNEYESVKAFGQNMADRKQKLLAGGKTEEEAKTEIARQLKEAGVAGEIRERKGLVRGFGRMGTELGGFKTFEDIEKGTQADFESQRVAQFQQSAEGEAAQTRSDQELADLEQGYKEQQVKLELDRARVRVTGSGRMRESRPIEEAYRTGVGAVSGVSPEQQIVNAEAIENLRKRAGEAPGTRLVAGAGDDQKAINAEMARLLGVIAINTASQKPLVAPQPVLPNVGRMP